MSWLSVSERSYHGDPLVYGLNSQLGHIVACLGKTTCDKFNLLGGF